MSHPYSRIGQVISVRDMIDVTVEGEQRVLVG